MKGVYKLTSRLTEEDLKRGIRNPYFKRLMTTVEVDLRKEDYQTFSEIAEQNGVPPEMIMRNCLSECAKDFRESD
jgi:hypothetical protein